jgi:tRNA pseudouridine38-40 synthase
MWRLWAEVAYDGTDFAGFQIQAPSGERTVQGELERALKAVTGAATRVTGAGRTDRGVHARGQVIGFEVEWRHPMADLQRALNAVLAADVALLRMDLASEEFHPRFSAVGRAYRYTLLNQEVRSPLERRTAWHVVQRLDVGQMNQASQCLVGTRNFAAFGSPPQGDNTVRTVRRAEWHEAGFWPKVPPPEGQAGAACGVSRETPLPWREGEARDLSLLVFDIEADAFLYRMVRSIVGMLVLVGSGQMSWAEFRAILQARDRSQITQVAPAHGLCLMRVDYGRREGVLQ